MGRKNFLSLAILVAVLVVTFPVSAFAAGSGSAEDEIMTLSDWTWEGTLSDNFNVTYRDDMDIRRTILVSAKCDVLAVWSEGNYGYVSEAFFFTPTASSDGQTVNLTRVENASQPSTYKYQDFRINSSNWYLRLSVCCDEWGNVSFTASLWQEVNYQAESGRKEKIQSLSNMIGLYESK